MPYATDVLGVVNFPPIKTPSVPLSPCFGEGGGGGGGGGSPLSHYLDLRIMSVYLDFCNTDYVMKQRKGF